MKVVQFILVSLSVIQLCVGIALAPETVGGVVASAGKISNTIKKTVAWRTFAAHPNSLVRQFPVRAMEVVREVVGSFRQEGRVVLVTKNGGLKGRIQQYKSGNKGFYYSFRGIRYGQPPVGNRRFRSALPEKPWRGVRNALKEGSPCPHRNMLFDNYKGNEDCLFINVYTPILPETKVHPQLPVMVWIHGGAFTFGSGNSFLYGPDFLVAEGVVLVTLNYRLGPLGFLSVGSDAPGNVGLKDQVLALKWVQENIAAFGGDPKQVTVFGESAGGASVQYLLISPMAAGLFNRAISQSGSALNPWALAEHPKDRAFRLGHVLGIQTNNTDELIEYLRRLPAKALIDGATKTLTVDDARKNIGLPFVPSIEETWTSPSWEGNSIGLQEEPFLTEHPLEILRTKNFNKVPYIIGYNTHEAMLFMRRLRKDPQLLDTINKDVIRLVPLDLKFPGGRDSPESHKIAMKIRDHYLGPRPITEDTLEEMIMLLTDIMFTRGVVETARLHGAGMSVTTPSTFVYRFGFDGSLGLYKRLLGISRPGVCHGDELGYLFHFGFFNLTLDPSSPEIQVKRRMVAMWTNFAKFGHPTPLGRRDPILGTNWISVNSSSLTDIPYLDITGNLDARDALEPNRLKFWDAIYNEFGL